MAMGAVLLPIKDPWEAKQRLSGVLSREERHDLAWAMLYDVEAAISEAKRIDGVYVVTSSTEVRDFALRRGWNVLVEPYQISESASVDWGSLTIRRLGIGEALRLPGDVPLIQAEDIDDLFEIGFRRNASVIVPSRDGSGTNALLRTPPDAFPSRFGPDSYRLHQEEAGKHGVPLVTVNKPRIGLDVDSPEDLTVFLQQGQTGHAWRFLRSIPLTRRLDNASA